MVAVVELTDVMVRKGTATLLDQVSWKVDETDRWVIIGPNGAGKTTLLQVLSTQLFPSSGKVTLLGETLGKVDVFELRPRIGVTSAAVAERIPKREPVRDVVVSAAWGVLGRWRESYDKQDYQRVDTLLSGLQIDHLAQRTFGTLSEGERKRVQIARALMSDPELLLMDEPAAGLDLAGREALVNTMAQICTNPSSPATVLVTHHVEEIPQGITHALLLSAGKILAAGKLSKVLTNENLSATFGLDLEVSEHDGRWSAKANWPARSAGFHHV